jgi:hypothetical protein
MSMTLQWQGTPLLACNGLPMPGMYAPAYGLLEFKSMSIIAGKPAVYTLMVPAQVSLIRTLFWSGHKRSMDMQHSGKP